jgi:metal-responsive CopG/Arc/MetJ family transcriptional regulator
MTRSTVVYDVLDSYVRHSSDGNFSGKCSLGGVITLLLRRKPRAKTDQITKRQERYTSQHIYYVVV